MGESSSSSINVLTSCDELRRHVKQLKLESKTIGIVPTMGALHAGHLSLVGASQSATDETIVTIFVNPTQFAPSEDLAQYPRDLESDLEKLAELGVKTVFAPPEREMYPPGCDTSVVPGDVAKPLEGEFRPTHFSGVATIVLKLFNLAEADQAFFGQKDFQQVSVIKKMVADLNLPVQIVVCPIIREPDGLALSSRNMYLSDAEREQARSLSETLRHVRRQIEQGERDGFVLISEMRQMLIDGGVTRIDYAVVANPDSLQVYDHVELPAVVLIAAFVGQTRLIDNDLIVPSN